MSFPVQPPGLSGDSVADLPSLLRFNKRINIAITRVTVFGGSTGPEGVDVPGAVCDPFALATEHADIPASGQAMVELVSTASVEWRGVLASGEKAIAVELSGIGDEAKIGVPVGVLQFELKLAPSPAAVSVIPTVGILIL